MELNYQSLAALFFSQATRYGSKVLYRFAQSGNWREFTWDEALRQVREITGGLVSLGVKRGDRVAILSNNRVEWNLIDWANVCLGALTVPIYASSPASQVQHIVRDCDPAVLFVESWEHGERLKPLLADAARPRCVIIADFLPNLNTARGPEKDFMTLAQLKEMGRGYSENPGRPFERGIESLGPEDDLTIIYTSGTTGEPKGVLTTHGHYLFMIKAVDTAISSTDADVTLHFLPSAHSLGRLEHFMAVAKGWTVGYARSLDALAKDLRIVRPTILFAVPRIYEIAFNRIRSRAERAPRAQKFIFQKALAFGRTWSRRMRSGEAPGLGLSLGMKLLNHLVFSQVRAAFGGNLKVAISGGAPLSGEVGEFFHALGMLILEGYGLTETSTVSHVNRPERLKFGTVGLPLPGIDCRIAADGEILLRGPNIFKGYYGDTKSTQQAIDEAGWFHTGDIGVIDSEGFLTITDRKKDLIVMSGGKKVAPQKIENLLKTNPLVSQAMIVGGGEKPLMALIALDQSRTSELAKEEGIEFTSPSEMTSHPWVMAQIKALLREKNRELAPFEAVTRFSILTREFAVGEEELTPTLKLRRQIIIERYKELIDEMYRKQRVES